MKTLTVVLAALSAGACAADRRPPGARFPICLYSMSQPAGLREVAESGFDCVMPHLGDPGGLEVARSARRLGLSLILDAGQAQAAPQEEIRRWPVLAWHLQDEPDVNTVTPAQLEALSRKVRAWNPLPQTFVVGSGRAAAAYGAIADVLMLDWYPVPHLKLDSVADELDLARRSLPPGKPLWMVIQAFDWKDEPSQRDPSKPKAGRFPTHAELRFMAYAAILHDANGLFFYRFLIAEADRRKNLLEFPERWQAVSRVAREIRSLQPVLEKGVRTPIPFPPNPDGVEARAWRHRGRDYVVILNRKMGFHQKVPDALLTPEWRPLFEAERDPRDILKKIGNAYFLQPYRVLVLESGRRWTAPKIKLW